MDQPQVSSQEEEEEEVWLGGWVVLPGPGLISVTLCALTVPPGSAEQ